MTRKIKQAGFDFRSGQSKISRHYFFLCFFFVFQYIYSLSGPFRSGQSKISRHYFVFFLFLFFLLLYTLISRGIVQKSDKKYWTSLVWFPRLSGCKTSCHYFVFVLKIKVSKTHYRIFKKFICNNRPFYIGPCCRKEQTTT